MEVEDLKYKKTEKSVVGYPGFWAPILGFLYFALAGFTCYSTYVVYNDFVDTTSLKDAQKTLEDTTVIYFSLMIAMIINSFICAYLFFIKDVNSYKILLFNCILGLVSFIVFSPYIIALEQGSDKSVIYPLVSSSLGLVLSLTIVVKMLWPKNLDYE
tara:strand:- start:1480 stop:1950 length:471 start_codon:yes stop_codon:yes gene_type:complete